MREFLAKPTLRSPSRLAYGALDGKKGSALSAIHDDLRDRVTKLHQDGQRLHLMKTVQAYPNALDGFDEKLAAPARAQSEKCDFSNEYQEWYSTALRVVQQLLPDRYDEFTELHRTKRTRKNLDHGNYTMSDYVSNVGTRGLDTNAAGLNRLSQMVQILGTAALRIDSLLADIGGALAAGLFDSELDGATELLKKGYGRASAVIAGVVLERHLRQVADSRGIRSRKKRPGIADFNNLLKAAEVYDLPVFRRVQAVADVRALAAHAKGREPLQEEVDGMLSMVRQLTKSIF